MTKKSSSGPGKAIEVSGGGPIQLKLIELGPNSAVMELGVNYSKAPVPERAYFADYCDVQTGRIGYTFSFGKLAGSAPKLRTKLEVTFPLEMFVKQLWKSSRDFHETVKNFSEKRPITPLGTVEDTERVQTFRANNVFMGTWGEESVLDFYYISPRDIHFLRIKQGAGVTLEPIVRIVLPTPVMYEFLEKCRSYVEKVVPDEDPEVI